MNACGIIFAAVHRRVKEEAVGPSKMPTVLLSSDTVPYLEGDEMNLNHTIISLSRTAVAVLKPSPVLLLFKFNY
jgi:hypothetical protein